jgi:hypothetical protein
MLIFRDEERNPRETISSSMKKNVPDRLFIDEERRILGRISFIDEEGP